jgi:hypothetical protein
MRGKSDQALSSLEFFPVASKRMTASYQVGSLRISEQLRAYHKGKAGEFD